jgi:hypothetical protein
VYNPRAMFKDENNYFAAFNLDDVLIYDNGYNYYFIGTNYFGGLILASSKASYSSCYKFPDFGASTYTMTP